MKIRPPRPIRAVKSLIGAWKGELPKLYKNEYLTETGEAGMMIWMDGEHAEPDLLKNTHEIAIPEQTEFVIDEAYKTEINGETIPLLLVVDPEIVSDHQGTVDWPDDWGGRELPVVDRIDALKY